MGKLETTSVDAQVTRQLRAAGEVLFILVVDSLIVGLDNPYNEGCLARAAGAG